MHHSRYVRSSAINVYLYYHNNSETEMNKLREIVKTEDVIFIDRVRKSSHTNTTDFRNSIKNFYLKHPQNFK